MTKVEPVDDNESGKRRPLDSFPKDTFNQVYWIVFLVGVIAMMPWDMMVTVNGYWTYKFRNTSLDEMFIVTLNKSKPGLTKRQIEFESYISIASSIPSAITVIWHAFVGNRFTIHWRALVSLPKWVNLGSFTKGEVIVNIGCDDGAGLFLDWDNHHKMSGHARERACHLGS